MILNRAKACYKKNKERLRDQARNSLENYLKKKRI